MWSSFVTYAEKIFCGEMKHSEEKSIIETSTTETSIKKKLRRIHNRVSNADRQVKSFHIFDSKTS